MVDINRKWHIKNDNYGWEWHKNPLLNWLSFLLDTKLFNVQVGSAELLPIEIAKSKALATFQAIPIVPATIMDATTAFRLLNLPRNFMFPPTTTKCVSPCWKRPRIFCFPVLPYISLTEEVRYVSRHLVMCINRHLKIYNLLVFNE